MSGYELNTHSTYVGTVAGHRMGYHEHAPGALYGLKYRASQKRYLVTVLGLQRLMRMLVATENGRLLSRSATLVVLGANSQMGGMRQLHYIAWRMSVAGSLGKSKKIPEGR
jgi:hypothetical protein